MSPEKIIIDGKDEPRLILSLPSLLCIETTKCFISSAYVAPGNWPFLLLATILS
jgi:hypothetical protein